MRLCPFVLLVICVVVRCAPAQLQPENVLVVVDRLSQDTLEVGLYYAEKRGIPPENVVRVICGRGPRRTNWPDFERRVFEPVMEHIRDNGLEHRINMIVLSHGLPYCVEGESATWMFYAHGVRLRKMNPYFRAGRPINARRDFGVNRYPAIMLSAFTREGAKQVVDRGLASDGTHPSGTVYFLRGGSHRGVRYRQVPPVAAELELMGIRSELLDGVSIADKPDVLGYFTGKIRVETRNTYLPGAFAEHMTSYGGVLYKRGGQMSVLEFIKAGATGTCGTVVEPLADWRKFPHASLYTAYARGLTLGEAMWQSVAMPYQVCFVGDPLACPFRRKPPAIRVLSVEKQHDARLRVRLSADAGDTGHRLESVLCAIDDNPPRVVFPRISSDTRIILTFHGRPIQREGGGGPAQVVAETVLRKTEPLDSALLRLADQINAQPEFPIRATLASGALQLHYLLQNRFPPQFACRCESVDGRAPAWLPSAKVCRFQGQSMPQPARTVFALKGRVKYDFEAQLRIDDVERAVPVTKGQTAQQVLAALTAAFGNEERFHAPGGLVFHLSGSANGWARLTVCSKLPGPEWNGRDVRLYVGGGSSGLQKLPHENTLKLLGGTLSRAGIFHLGLTRNALPAGKAVTVTIGEKTIRYVPKGDALRHEILAGLLREIQTAAPPVQGTIERNRIVLTCNAEQPPALAVASDSEAFTAEFLGNRWARIRSFPPPGGNPGNAWIAFLQLHVGLTALECETEINFAELPEGAQVLKVFAVFGGDYRIVRSVEHTLRRVK